MTDYNVLSVCDGISCGQKALERAGIKFTNYFASEINPHSIVVTQNNYPHTIQLGDIQNYKSWDLPEIHLLISGTPCQGFSFAGKQLNFEDPRSKLFFEFYYILLDYKPKYFLFENVPMQKQFLDVISKHLCVEPIMIDSRLVSAQSRKRYYWTNIPIEKMPEDKGICLKDILEEKGTPVNYSSSGRGERGVECRLNYAEKSYTLTKTGFSKRSVTAVSLSDLPKDFRIGGKFNREDMPHLERDKENKLWNINGEKFRDLTTLEMERLQTLPDNYTAGIDEKPRQKALGDGWTVDIIAHILRGIKNDF